MELNDKQEQLSVAVLHATCASAGFAFQISDRIQDNWGWDAIAEVHERLVPEATLYNFRLKFQLKATRQQLLLRNGRYSFPLERAHYDRFRTLAGYDAPLYLVVFQLPVDEEDWLRCTPEQLVLKRCLRWISLRNAPAVDSATTTVYFPAAQMLTPAALRKVATARALEKWIDYNQDGVADAEYT